MEAFGENGIPHSFVIDKSGAIVWHGHPGSGLDGVLEKVAAGKYDTAGAKKVEAAKKTANQYVELMQKAGKTTKDDERKDLEKKAKQLGDQIVKDGGKDAEFMNQFAWFLLTADVIKNRDMDLAVKAAKAALDASEGKDPSILDTYAKAMFDTGKKADAVKHQKKAIELCKDERMVQELKKTLARYEKDAPAKK
jgi:hypothetical protein